MLLTLGAEERPLSICDFPSLCPSIIHLSHAFEYMPGKRPFTQNGAALYSACQTSVLYYQWISCKYSDTFMHPITSLILCKLLVWYGHTGLWVYMWLCLQISDCLPGGLHDPYSFLIKSAGCRCFHGLFSQTCNDFKCIWRCGTLRSSTRWMYAL